MKGHPIAYSDEEIAWLDRHRTLPIGELHAGFCSTFARSDVSASNLKSLRTRKGWVTGRTGRFQPGTTPANKGRKMPFNANSAATQFKPGVRQGRAAQLYKPIGTERLSKEGYLERKVHDGMPLQSRWRAVHLIEWEANNGPVPPGMCLKCLDGDRSNLAQSNWELIPRSMLPRLNGRYGRDYDSAPDEIRPTLMSIAKLEHRARKAAQRP